MCYFTIISRMWCNSVSLRDREEGFLLNYYMAKDGQKTAGILVIGNEILSGKVRDVNSSFLASELRDLGISLMRILVIPDDEEIIGKEVRAFSEAYDYVLTSGGIGPTHDDVTILGIARGFGVNVVQNSELVERFRMHYGERLNDAVMRMARVPEGAELIDPGNMKFPIVIFKNIYIFPGIPKYLIEKFSAVRERFRSSAFCIRRFFVNANETDIASILDSVVAENPEVVIGSYPIVDNPGYRIIITAESKMPDALREAADGLLRRLPRNILVAVE